MLLSRALWRHGVVREMLHDLLSLVCKFYWYYDGLLEGSEGPDGAGDAGRCEILNIIILFKYKGFITLNL